MIAHIQHVLASRANQLREHVAVAARVHLVALKRARVTTELLYTGVLLEMLTVFYLILNWN